MPDTLTAEAMSTAQPAMSAFKTGLDWAQSFAQNTLKAQQNEMMRQQTQQMQDELNMKKGQWLSSNMTKLALMPEGKLKNGLIDSFYENAQKAGLSLHPTVGDALHDPTTAPMIANIGQALAQGDPAHAPFYGAYAKYYGAYGEFDP